VTIFELPHIAEINKEFVKGTTISVKAGDFWKDILPSADVAFYSDIFHDYTEKECILLAKKSFDSLMMGGRIILHELPFNNDEKTLPLSAAVHNFSVIRWTRGRQYSINELMGFLKEAGFSQLECIPTEYLDWILITGVKPFLA
jgi:acetylserotonin N-methyltransferase